MRRIIHYALVAIMVAFLTVATFSNNALAANAQWDGGALKYDGNNYVGPANSKTVSDLGLPKDTIAYTYVDSSSSSAPKIHVIYFKSSVDVATANKANYRTQDYKAANNFPNPSSPIAIDLTPQVESTDHQEASSCELEGGTGWIICPITNLLASWMDWVFNVLTGFLEVKPVNVNQQSTLLRAWSFMRSIANIAFVIVFLIMIYSQLTSWGISNYGIKKTLPRLIITAILVNLSYVICALAIDVSNVLGFSLQDMFLELRNSLVGNNGNGWDLLSWESISSFVLSAGTATIAGGIALFGVVATNGVIGSLALLLPALLAGLLAVIVALVVLAARQALIVILTILAPLAFVAYLLPNTEKLFNKWRSLFMTMLILFPAVSVVFGGSQLAASAIIQNADSINLVILGMIIQVVPLFLTPMLVKASGSMGTMIANAINKPGGKILDSSRAWSKERAEEMRNRRMATPARPGIRGSLQRAGQRKDHVRRRRAGWRSAHTAAADSLFDKSKAGQDILQAQKRAGFEKASADSAAHERWEKAVYSQPGLARQRRKQIVEQGQGDLYKAGVDAAGKESLARSIRHSPLYQVKKQQIAAEGSAKIDSDWVDARAQNAFRQAVLGDRYLHDAEKSTYEFTKRAEFAQANIQTEAEADWNRLQLTDSQLRTQQLKKTATSLQAKKAEEQWNKIVAEIMAKGSDAPNIHLGEKALAKQIHDGNLSLSAEVDAKGSAEYETKLTYSDALKDNTFVVDGVEIRKYAGGVSGETGAQRAFAAAINARSRANKEAVVNLQSIFSHYNFSDDTLVKFALGDNDGQPINITDDVIIAAIDKIANGANKKAILDLARDIEISPTASNPDFQQTFAEALLTNSAKPTFAGAVNLAQAKEGIAPSAGANRIRDWIIEAINKDKYNSAKTLVSEEKIYLDELLRVFKDPASRNQMDIDSLKNIAEQLLTVFDKDGEYYGLIGDRQDTLKELGEELKSDLMAKFKGIPNYNNTEEKELIDKLAEIFD